MFSFFFCNDTATTQIYTLSLHDALPISRTKSSVQHRPLEATRSNLPRAGSRVPAEPPLVCHRDAVRAQKDRKSTRLNSSHANISYAVFCLKKKKKKKKIRNTNMYKIYR